MSSHQPASRLPRALRPFSNGQYRLLTSALLCSLFSAGIWLVASVWQVIELGGSATDLSFVAFGAGLGLVLSVLVGGAVADRIPQRVILLVVELVRGLGYGVAAVLALSGAIQVWQLGLIACALGVADGFFYPAYSAWLPALIEPDELLAANGIEGMLRPTIMQAAGPAVASAIIALWSPAVAFLAVAVLQLGAVAVLAVMRTTPVRREIDRSKHPLVGALIDIRDGFRYMVQTRWLLSTLLFATLLVLVVMGPIEVLLPFAVKDQTGGGAGAFAIALAAFGVGGAIGSLAVASRRMPRRYLTMMIMAWGVGCLPLAIIGYTDQLWLMVIALFVCGFLFSGAQVLWGTLLQRRVPSGLLGRVSSLDFFVSLALMPISMAIAGPVGDSIGIAPAFLIAGLIPTVLAVGTLVIARLGPDERDHPLDGPSASDPEGSPPAPAAAVQGDADGGEFG
ncbi:MAG: MFS transporter, partial [Nakamurella sp.]